VEVTSERDGSRVEVNECRGFDDQSLRGGRLDRCVRSVQYTDSLGRGYRYRTMQYKGTHVSTVVEDAEGG